MSCIVRVAALAKTIRPAASIQVTNMELVIGKPKGRAISTACCERPCSTFSQRRSTSCATEWMSPVYLRPRVADRRSVEREGSPPSSRIFLRDVGHDSLAGRRSSDDVTVLDAPFSAFLTPGTQAAPGFAHA